MPELVYGLDFETCRFRPGLQAPPIVCMSESGPGSDELHVGTEQITKRLRWLLADRDALLVWHNAAYDIACAHEWLDLSEELFAALEADRVVDTWVHERLAEISGRTGRKHLNLGVVAAAYGLEPPDKSADVRTDYGRLLGKPVEAYSKAHIDYAMYDAVAARKVWLRQRKRHGGDISIKDVAFLTRRQVWLQLTRNYGVRTDPKQIARLRAATKENLDQLIDIAKEAGFIRDNGTRDMKAIRAWVSEAYDGSPPMTRPQKNRKSKKQFVPQVSAARSTLEESGDPVLEMFADYGEWSSVNNKDLPMLEAGTLVPIHTRFGIADTTRTTSSGPNMQNFRRAAGIREAVIPRPGFCFLNADHGGLESCCLAQVIYSKLGRTEMLDKINAGQDLHCHIGAVMRGCSYDEFYRLAVVEKQDEPFRQRQLGKVVNFGRPGGMGAKTLKFFAKQSYQLDLTQETCKYLISVWNEAHPDGKAYLDWINTLPRDRNDRFCVRLPGYDTLVRRGATYCAAANCNFQTLGAALETEVGWILCKQIQLGRGALSFCRMVNFIHDEFMLECPIGIQTEAAAELVDIMTGPYVRRFLPDVTIDAEPVAMMRWTKSARTNKNWRQEGLMIND